MAKDENTEAEGKGMEGKGGESAPARPSRKKFMTLAIIGAGVVIILAGGFAGWKFFLHNSGETGNADATVKQDKENVPGQIVALEPFVVNLAEPSEVTYLKMTVNLEVESEITAAEIQAKMPQIRDAVLMLLTSKTSDDVKDTGGKLKLQDDMVARMNHFIHTGKVKAVYFTEFVMQ